MNYIFELLNPYGDNTTSLQNLNVLDLSMNSKYIDFTSKFILVRALRNDLKLMYVPSSENVADIFTKALGAALFLKLKGMLGSSS